MSSRIWLATLAVAATLLGVSAAEEKAVINALYELPKKLCKVPEGGQWKEGELATNVAHPSGARAISQNEIVTYLHSLYPVTPQNAVEFEMTTPELIQARIYAGLPTRLATSTDPIVLAYTRKHEIRSRFPDHVRFGKDMDSWRYRRALLRLIEASYSGGSDGYLVTRRVSGAPKEIQWSEYRPLKNKHLDDLVLAQFFEELANYRQFTIAVRGEADRRPIFEVICPIEGKDSDEIKKKLVQGHDGNGTASPQWEVNRIAPSLSWVEKTLDTVSAPFKVRNVCCDNSNITLQPRFVLDETQFTIPGKKAEAATFSQTVDANDDTASGVTADAAVGFVLRHMPYKLDWLDKQEGCTLPAGQPCSLDEQLVKNKFWARSLILFGKIDQQPVKYDEIDADDPLNDDGSDNIITKTRADATIFGGLRYEREEFMPVNQDNYRRRPGHKYALTAGWFTDNYSDLQGFKAEIGYTPRLPLKAFGYRTPRRLFANSDDPQDSREVRTPKGDPLGFRDIMLSGYFQWDATMVMDHISYARAPFDFETPEIGDRITDRNQGRYGADISASLNWSNIFGLAPDEARLKLGVDYTYRDGFEDQTRTAQNVKVSLKLLDIINGHYGFGLAYEKGTDELSFKDFDFYSIEASARF